MTKLEVRFKKKKTILRETVCLMKTSRDLQMTCSAVKHLEEGLSLETSLKLKVEKSIIFLMGI
jgi:hypothetical protein